jgi:hypothetical protein
MSEFVRGNGGILKTAINAKKHGKTSRYVQLPFVPFHHHLHALGPALDNLVGSKRGGIATIVAGVKLGPIQQLPLVVAQARSRGGGMVLARSVPQNLVLKPGRQRHHARLLRVLLQELQALFIRSNRKVDEAQQGDGKQENLPHGDGGHFVALQDKYEWYLLPRTVRNYCTCNIPVQVLTTTCKVVLFLG